MREFSLSRVANYMRYCYTAQAKNYAWNVLSMFATPLFFALLTALLGGSMTISKV